MAKTTNKPAAATPAKEAAAASAEKKTTDKSYASLAHHEEIVVQTGPRVKSTRNKVVTIEEARNVIFTKAGYEAMDRYEDEENETMQTPTKVLGIPNYITVVDPTVYGGKRKDFEVLYFKDGAGYEDQPKEEQESEDEE